MRLDSILPPRELSRAVSSSESVHRLQLLADQFLGTQLATFACWEDARRWLDRTGARTVAADVVLKPILTAFRRQPDEVWLNILLFLFWRSQSRIYRALRGRVPNPDDVGSEVRWAFLRVLHRLDPTQRIAAYGQKIINDMWHDVRLHCERERARQERFPTPAWEAEDDQEEDDPKEPGAPDPAFAMVGHRHDAARIRADLKGHVRCGRLSRADYLILVGCYLYGRSLDEMAGRLGLTYEVAKKRRQRALERLKK